MYLKGFVQQNCHVVQSNQHTHSGHDPLKKFKVVSVIDEFTEQPIGDDWSNPGKAGKTAIQISIPVGNYKLLLIILVGLVSR